MVGLTGTPVFPAIPGIPCSPWRPISPGFPGAPLAPSSPCGPVTPFGPSSPGFPACNQNQNNSHYNGPKSGPRTTAIIIIINNMMVCNEWSVCHSPLLSVPLVQKVPEKQIMLINIKSDVIIC